MIRIFVNLKRPALSISAIPCEGPKPAGIYMLSDSVHSCEDETRSAGGNPQACRGSSAHASFSDHQMSRRQA
eukprot:6212258-Pleurochrysis_carterae.AAC.1